jgi:RNA polymerase sigma-70 factor (ECF subfamily)
LIAYACSFGLDLALAQDVVQQVFLKILSGEFALSGIPAGYAFRAVRNTCLNRRRDGAKEVPLEAGTRWLVHREGNREAEITLQNALTSLPEDQRQVVIMHIWGGMTLYEVAVATEVPLNTAASRYRYALQKLREAFDVDNSEKRETAQ